MRMDTQRLILLTLCLAFYGFQASARNGDTRSSEERSGCSGYGGRYSYYGDGYGCRGFDRVRTTPAFILPPLTQIPAGNGTDQVIPTALSGSELKNSLKALDNVIKSSTNKYPRGAPMAAKREFQSLASFMQKHPGGQCSDVGAGMVCTGADGRSATYNVLREDLVARALANKDTPSGNVAATVAQVNAEANAAYASYLVSNGNTLPVAVPAQAAFVNAPAVVLPQSTDPNSKAIVTTTTGK